MKENSYIRKLSLDLKFMMSQTWQQIVTIHILLKVSQGKINQTMKFCQLIQYNMRNIFLEKSFAKCGGDASPRLFYKKLKLIIYLNQKSEM